MISWQATVDMLVDPIHMNRRKHSLSCLVHLFSRSGHTHSKASVRGHHCHIPSWEDDFVSGCARQREVHIIEVDGRQIVEGSKLEGVRVTSASICQPKLRSDVQPHTTRSYGGPLRCIGLLVRSAERDVSCWAELIGLIGGASSAVRAQCNYLGVWPY